MREAESKREGKEWLFGKTLEELRAVVEELGMPRFTAKQLSEWLYKQHATQIEQMTNISLKNRELLSERYCVGGFEPQGCSTSQDGTKKYLFPTLGNRLIESALIPDRERATLCVSSQVGCKMGCKFCMTARMGFVDNLTAGEIVNQLRSIPEFEKLTNVVYMGMGEPMDNLEQVLRSLEIICSDWGYGWSPSRVTLSTIGVLPALEHFLSHSKAHLAVSLHSPFDKERESLMPAQKAFPIKDVIDTISRYDFSRQRRVSFEYIVLKGINDTPEHIRGLINLLSGIECRINLIRFHAIPGSPYVSPNEEQMVAFRDALTQSGLFTTIRASRGEDIEAACGLLSTKKESHDQ